MAYLEFINKQSSRTKQVWVYPPLHGWNIADIRRTIINYAFGKISVIAALTRKIFFKAIRGDHNLIADHLSESKHPCTLVGSSANNAASSLDLEKFFCKLRISFVSLQVHL